METGMAYCGLLCDSCSIHLATLEQDESRQRAMRKAIAGQIREHYGMDVQPEDITDCDGCRADTGRIYSGCVNCEIKKCARQKHLESCAFCSDFACDRLKDLFTLDPDALSRLEEIRRMNY